MKQEHNEDEQLDPEAPRLLEYIEGQQLEQEAQRLLEHINGMVNISLRLRLLLLVRKFGACLHSQLCHRFLGGSYEVDETVELTLQALQDEVARLDVVIGDAVSDVQPSSSSDYPVRQRSSSSDSAARFGQL